jgi:hypothetical protein
VCVPGLDQRTSESETAAGTASRDARPAFFGALDRGLAGGAAVAGGAPRRPSMVVAWVAAVSALVFTSVVACSCRWQATRETGVDG